MRAATLLTVVRENASTHLFTQVTTNVPADVQDTEQTEPAVTPDQSGAQAAGLPLTPHAVYTSHTIFAPAVSGVLPDIRIGDQLVDPADVDPRTSLAATYTVMLVRRWSWHVVQHRGGQPLAAGLVQPAGHMAAAHHRPDARRHARGRR